MDNQNKLTDEEIQQLMDSKSFSQEKSTIGAINDDAYIYDLLMKNLDVEPSITIPKEFEKSTLGLAIRRKIFKDLYWKMLLYISISIPLIAISFAIIYFMGKSLFWEYVQLIGQNSIYILFTGTILIIIQLLDKLLIQNKLNQA